MSRKKKKSGVNYTVLGIGFAVVVPVMVLFGTSFGNNPHAVPSVLEHQPAPGFSLVDLDGMSWTLDALKGQPVVLNFWSTWCGPCKYEHDDLQRAARQNPDVKFLGVIYSDEPDKCRRYLRQVGTAYEHLVDTSGRTAIDYGVAGVPETFFINAAGTIVHKQVGPVNARILQRLMALTREAP